MRRRGAAVGRRAGDAVRSEREKTAGAAIERRRPRRAHLWMRANPAMNIGGVGTSGTRSPRARVRSSVRAECRVPRHRLAASVRARAVDDVHARSRVPEADCGRRDEKPRGSPRHRKVVDSLSRSRARRSRFGETIAVGAVPRAPPAVAVSLRETRGRRRRPRPGFTRHRERRDEGAFATRPRSAGGARRARPVAPRRSVDPAPQHRGVTRRFPSGRDRALTTLPFDTLRPRPRRRSAPRSSVCATRARS